MKKLFSLFARNGILMAIIILAATISQTSYSQLTGTKNIPGDYATLALAITDLNLQGVGAGGVTLNLIAGNPETSPAGGYSIIATGTAANQIVIQGNGNTITAPTTHTIGALNDAIFKVIGADFVTITNFIMNENPANLNTVAATNNMTEWGVAVLYATTINGAQNVTISGNTITLNRNYQNTFGIYSNSTHSPTSVTVSATAIGANGGNHNLRVYSNIISNVNNGIVVVGPTAAADHNTGIDIGGSSSAQGNTITNYGTTGTFSGYANVSGTVYGVLVRNSTNYNISYNSITSSIGGSTALSLRGIYVPSFSNAPTGTFTQTINNNDISVRSGIAAGIMQGISTELTTGTVTSILNIRNNNFNNITHTVAGTGAITFISNAMPVQLLNIENNTFTNISCNTSGNVTFISSSVLIPSGGQQNVNGNQIITGFTKTTAGGTVTFFTTNASSLNGAVSNNLNNNFSNITLTGATTIAGWSNTDGASSANGPTKTIAGNTFSNISTGSASVTIISSNFGNNGTKVYFNTISNISNVPTSSGFSLTAISIGSSNGGAEQSCYGNYISGLTTTVFGGQTMGIFGGSTTVTTMNVYGNTIYGFSSNTASQTVGGIYFNTSGLITNIYKNKIFDLTANNAAAIGITAITPSAANTFNIYNNIIGRLYAPNSLFYQAVRGILLGSGVACTNNLYYNTIYLDGTTVSQTYCVYIGNNVLNVPNVNAVNNVFENNVTSSNGVNFPNTVYFRYGTTNGTNLTASTNNNILYGGIPDPSHLIYVDGTVAFLTNPIQTLPGYQLFVSPSENLSKTELSPFLNTTTGVAANYLHINPLIPTFIEGNGASVPGITDDYDGEDRSTLTPVDIGADAGNFTSAGDVTPPVILYSALTNTSSTSNRAFVNVLITDPSGVQITPPKKPKVYYKRLGDANTWNDNTSSTDGWKYADANGSSSPFDFTIDYSLLNGGGGVTIGNVVQYFVVAEDMAATPNVGINSGTFAATPPTCLLDASAFPIGGPINFYQITGAPLSGTYTVGLSMMKPLTGMNIEAVKFTRKVKQMVPDENRSVNTTGKKERSADGHNTVKYYDEDALKGPMKEVYIDEDYYELQENGRKYTGSGYAEYNHDNRGGQGDMVGNYLTITDALTDLNTRGVSGAVTFLLIDANYAGETYPLQFNNNIAGISASNNVTLKPQTGVTATIPGNISANATIRILSNYVTIDGSNSGGTDRSLTIQNNSVVTPSVVLVGSTGTTTITNVMVKNCTITNGIITSTAVVISDAGTLGNQGYFNTVTIQNNLIQRSYIGVYATGGIGSQTGSNLFYYNNSLNSIGANAIGFCGLYMQGVNTSIVSQNTLANFNGATNEDDRAIWIAAGSANGTVERNNISALNYIGSNGYGGQGIVVTTVLTGANVTVKNNMISNLSGDGWDYNDATFGTDNTIGICIGTTAASTQSGINVYNNSIFLSGNTLNQANALSMGIYAGVGASGIDLRNNIIVNNLGLLALTGAGSTCVSLRTSAAQLTSSSYNCYYAGATGIGTKAIGYIVSAFQTTIAGWRTATGQDAQSFNGQPLFTSSTDLHIQASDLMVSGRGNYIAGNNNDYDGNTRATAQSTTIRPVDVGCDQYIPASYTGNVTVLSGSTYFDNNLKAIEITSGTFTASQVRQFPGVRTPNNTAFKNNIDPVKNNNNETKGRKQEEQKELKKDGKSGGNMSSTTVNTPWIYWEIDNLIPTSEPITLRFYYNDDQLAAIAEGNLKISYWNGTVWNNSFVQSVDGTNNFISVTLPTGIAWPSTSLFAVEDQTTPLPVTLSGFDASVVNRDVILRWGTSYELNNRGFSIEKRVKTSDVVYASWKEISFVNGRGNSNELVNYTFTDKKLNSGAYQYRLKQVDFNGNYEYYSPANNTDMIIGKPGSFDLGQNYPNPSNPKSKIDFQIPFDGKVSLKVYDILGKEITTLIDEFKAADFYTVEFDGSNIASGIYFYRIIADGNNQKFTKTLKMILVK